MGKNQEANGIESIRLKNAPDFFYDIRLDFLYECVMLIFLCYNTSVLVLKQMRGALWKTPSRISND